MQYKVPQNVQREDRIVGPLTLKQLIICAVGGGIAYAIYVSLGREYEWITWLPPVAFIAILTLLFAFIRPLDLSFARFIFVYLEFLLLPQKRSWVQSSAEINMAAYTTVKKKTKAQEEAEAKASQFVDKAKRLQEISKILDTHGKTLEQ